MGGILADDMGLGKTLTTLALIVASLERARDFVSLASQRRSEREGAVTNHKASVVIVPSERNRNATLQLKNSRQWLTSVH